TPGPRLRLKPRQTKVLQSPRYPDALFHRAVTGRSHRGRPANNNEETTIMSKTPLARAVALATLGASLTLPPLAQADFIGDSKATLELRNFYMNRDLRDPGVAQSKREEWAQGFIFKAESGFTEGTVGFGLDAYAGLGLKLDSSDERAFTGLLPNAVGDEGPAEYSEFSGAVKARISKTVAKVGGLMPKLPIVSAGDSRLLPQVFPGGMITSQGIDGLTLNG